MSRFIYLGKYKKGILTIKRNLLKIDFNDHTQKFTWISNHPKKIKGFPNGLNGESLLIYYYHKIGEFYDIQIVCDIDNFQAYYKYKINNSFCNWTFINPAFIKNNYFYDANHFVHSFKLNEQKNKRKEQTSLSQFEDVFDFQNFCKIQNILKDDFEKYVSSYDKCIISFIDDDSSCYIDEIWKLICEQKQIKIGFACVTGFLSKEVITIRPEDEQISICRLKNYYDKGFDVYSHSNSHKYFYDPYTKLKMIDEECRKSKKYLIDSGFQRSSNIIVYPGGLGYQRIRKKQKIKKYFAFGVDTVGQGINETIDDFCIHRINLDSTNLESIRDYIDIAIEKKCLMVFMSHSFELNKNKEEQCLKICNIIDYINSKNIEILPFSEAIKIKNLNCIKSNKMFSFGTFIKELRNDYLNIKKRLKKRQDNGGNK